MAPTAAPGRRLVRTREAADFLGVSPWRVRQLVGEGVLDPVRFTPRSQFRFRVADLEALVDSRKETSR
jgi:excisionase family DNA binding protein